MAKRTTERNIVINANTHQVEKLTQALVEADEKVDELEVSLRHAYAEIDQLQQKIDNMEWNTGVGVLKEELKNFKNTANVAKQELQKFLETANLVSGPGSMDDRFRELFRNLEKGTMTVSQAIARVKTEYAHLMEENFAKSGGAFDAKVLQNFEIALKNVSDTLTVVLQKVEQIQTEGVRSSGGGGGGNSAANIAQMFNEIRTSAEEMSDAANKSLDSIANLIGAMGKYADLPETKLLAVSQAFRNMADLHSGSFSSGSVDNIIRLAKGLTEMYKPFGSSLKFDFTGLKDFKVSSTIKYLSEFLEKTNTDQLAMLEKIGKVDLTNISDMKGGTTFQHIATLMQALNGDGIHNLTELGHINLDNLSNIKLSKATVDNLLRLFQETGGGAALSGLIDAAKATEDFGNKSSKAASQAEELRQKVVETAQVEETVAQEFEQEAQAVEHVSQKTGNASTALTIYSRALNDVAGTISIAHRYADLMAAAQARQQQAATNAAYAQELYRAAAERSAQAAYAMRMESITEGLRQQALAAAEAARMVELYRQTLIAAGTAGPRAMLPKNAGGATTDMAVIEGEFVDHDDTNGALERRNQLLLTQGTMAHNAMVAVRDYANAWRDEAAASGQSTNSTKRSLAEQIKLANNLRSLNTLLKQVEAAKKKLAEQPGGKDSDLYGSFDKLGRDIEALKPKLEGMDFQAQKGAIAALRLQYSELGIEMTKTSKSASRMEAPLRMIEDRMVQAVSAGALITAAIRQIRNMINEVTKLDTAMTQLRIVTNNTELEYDAYGKRMSDTAKQLGASVADLVDSTTVYARLGYTLGESSELARVTAMLKNVGDIDISTAQDAITVMTKAFKDVDATNIESVMDKLVTVGNNFPVSVKQLADGINNAGSALSASGNSFEQAIALLTSANTATQDINKASTGLRTIAARIRKTTFDLDELGETIEEAKYQEALDILTGEGVSLTDENGYRSTYDILKDIAAVWEDLSTMDQAAVAEQLAGKHVVLPGRTEMCA